MNETLWTNIAIYVLFIWSLFWKGIALWRASQFKQRNWFVVMLVLNTVGILEIIYLFRFAKKRLTFKEMGAWKNYFMKKVPENK
jgi:predicted membrane channel-forming protein YqfA (hemolysin III family)